jgi:hypothetical protein
MMLPHAQEKQMAYETHLQAQTQEEIKRVEKVRTLCVAGARVGAVALERHLLVP